MRPTVKSERGMSLVEATIILMVLSILTAVLSPSIIDYVDDARHTKAKEDVEAIGLSIARLLKDTGAPFLLEDGSVALSTRFNIANRVDLAVGDGVIPIVHADADAGLAAAANVQGAVTWTDAVNTANGKDTLYRQLIANLAFYTQPTSTTGTWDPSAPGALGKFGLGWRGAYLSPVIGPDPWGYRYAVNSVFLGSGLDAVTASSNGGADIGWYTDTFVVSPGANGQIEYHFETSATTGGTRAAGTQNDDIVYVISGYGR